MEFENRGWTPLHSAAQHGHLDRVKQLLAEGADVHARETGDNTTPLHWAAAQGDVAMIRALVDAGADVHGFGDVHELDVIGWATVFSRQDANEHPNKAADPRAAAALLVERGARHHIFSAIALGDADLVRQVAANDLKALDRRLSRFEHKQTPLHFAVDRKRTDLVDLLISLGADLNAPDMHGQTAIALATIRGDLGAVDRLTKAGAKPPERIDPSRLTAAMGEIAASSGGAMPMIFVPDVAETLEWYKSIGFTEVDRVSDRGEGSPGAENDGVANWGLLAFGRAQMMLNMHGRKGEHDVHLWFYTDRVDDMYRLVKTRQLAAAAAKLAGEPSAHLEIDVVDEIYDPPYGGREFTIRDLNGYRVSFRKG